MTDQRTAQTHRSIDLTRIGEGRYKAVNRRGGVLPIGSGQDPDFSPVELLLAALAGCAAIDVDGVTSKRAQPETFAVRAEGHKIRDEHGSRMVDLTVTCEITFPAGEDGDRAREVLPRTLAQVRDRVCTVGRTLSVGAQVRYPGAQDRGSADPGAE